MSPKGTGSRADNIEADQDSPKEGVTTLAEKEEAMTPDESEADDEEAYRDEEE